MATIPDSPVVSAKSAQKQVVISARITEEQLQALNIRLKVDGYENIGQLLRDYSTYKFPKYSKDEQVEKLLARIKEKNIKDPFTGEVGSVTFYENVDRNDFLGYLLQRYHLYDKHGRDMFKYWEKWCKVFFTKPELILTESPSVREWITGAMRRFGEYWDLKFHDPEVRLLIDEADNRSVTDRIDARLMAGGYESYSQIAREERTTEDFVSKRACELKKEGKLVGDRRSSKSSKPGSGEDMLSNATTGPLAEKLFADRMEAYRLMGVPEEDIEIMKKGHFDLDGLRKAKELARGLKHNRRAEKLAKDFPTMAELDEFEGFFREARKSGVKRSQYAAVMGKVQESTTLDNRLYQQNQLVEENDNKLRSIETKSALAEIHLEGIQKEWTEKKCTDKIFQ